MIDMEFNVFGGRSILVKDVLSPLCTFQCEVPANTYLLLLFSIILYTWQNLPRSEFNYLKQSVGVVGALGMFPLLDLYFLDRNDCFQEHLLPVGLQQEHQYPSIIGGCKVMGKLFWSGGTLSGFLKV